MKTTEEPKRIKIEKKSRKIYDDIKSFDFFESLENNNDLFILAMALGFYEGEKEKLKGPDQYFFTHTFSNEQKSMIKSLAVFEKDDLDILLDKKEVYNIAEEYANGGIKILENMILSTEHKSSFMKRFESMVFEELEEIDFDEIIE